MKLPRKTRRPESLLHSYGVYAIAQMRTDSEAATALAIIETAQQNLADHVQSHEQAQIALVESMALRDRAAHDVTRSIKSLAFTIKSVNNNSKDSTLYWQYFPDGFGKPAGFPLIERSQFAAVLLEKLATETVEEVAAHAGPLAQAVESLAGAIDAFDAAILAEKAASALLKVERQKWIDAYRATYGTLLALFPEDRSRVESYFRSFIRRRIEEEVDDEPGLIAADSGEAGSNDEAGVETEGDADIEAISGEEEAA